MKQISRQLTATLMLLSLFFMATHAVACFAVEVEAPWIREAPPGATVLAAYMVLSNSADTQSMITRIESPDFRDTRIHRTVVEDGVAKMLSVEHLQVPAHGSVTLEPGGMHLMLFDPLRPLQAGDTVTLVVHESNGDSVTVQAPVVRMTGEDDHAHHH
jgi:hypothetical protein